MLLLGIFCFFCWALHFWNTVVSLLASLCPPYLLPSVSHLDVFLLILLYLTFFFVLIVLFHHVWSDSCSVLFPQPFHFLSFRLSILWASYMNWLCVFWSFSLVYEALFLVLFSSLLSGDLLFFSFQIVQGVRVAFYPLFFCTLRVCVGQGKIAGAEEDIC